MKNVILGINVSSEPLKQIAACFQNISTNIPSASVVIFEDGVERPDIAEIARRLDFKFVKGTKHGNNREWHLWWLRMLHAFEASGCNVCFKIDPDTMVDGRPKDIPVHDYFGDVHISTRQRFYIQGGITGMSRYSVLRLLNSGLLEPQTVSKWQLGVGVDTFMDDHFIGMALGLLGISPTKWIECRSEWKTPFLNNPIRWAIVHPRYYY